MNRLVNRKSLFTWVAALVLTAASSQAATVVLPVEVTSALPVGTIPMDVDVDFAAIVAEAKQPGWLKRLLDGLFGRKH